MAKTSVGFEAAAAIKALILSGELKPGDSLPSERVLAVMLGISRPSLREAIHSLSMMNVLEPRHGGGTYVTSLHPRLLAQPISFLLQIDPMAFHHLFEVRRVLETGAAKLAALVITDDEIAELDRIVTAAGRAIARPGRYLELDLELHAKVVEATSNPIFISLYQSIADLSIERQRETARSPVLRRKMHEDHLAIVAALRDRDPEAVAEAMDNHLDTLQHEVAPAGAQRAVP